MTQYCCVPGCTQSGGNQFPVEKDLNLKWRVAIKRTDPVTRDCGSQGNMTWCAQHISRTTISECRDY